MKRTLKTLVAALAISSASYGALLTDGVDTVTYGVFTYKWKNLVDTLYFQKMKNPYMYYKLSGLQNTTPFMATWEFGYGTPIQKDGKDVAWLALAAAYKDTTAYNASNAQAYDSDNLITTNSVSITNGASLTRTYLNQTTPFGVDKWNATIDGSVGFGFRAGDSVINLQYYFQSVNNYTTATSESPAGANTDVNGTNTVTQNRTFTYGSTNQNAFRNQLSFGVVSGVFELQGNVYIRTVNGINNQVAISSNRGFSVGNEGTARVSSLAANKIVGETAPSFTSASSSIDPSTFLKGTQIYFDLSPRVENIGDMKFYLLGSYTTYVFDASSNNQVSAETSAVAYNTNNGSATNTVTSSWKTEFLKPSYNQFQAQLRMKRVWKEDKVSFGIYPRYYLTTTDYSIGRQATSNVTIISDTNADGMNHAGDTNYTRTWVGGVDTRQVSTLQNQIRLPMSVQWAASKQLTLWAGITGVFTHTLTTTTLTENQPASALAPNLNAGEYLSYADSTSSALAQTVKGRDTKTTTVAPSFGITGSYAIGLGWKPSDKVEFLATLNKEKTFNLSGTGADSGLFDGADIQFIYNF
ncbi:MAG: hypothetical protein J0L75_17840 [Spirochaetes bacterium]|nr:hypothetical protein [Spirochaetota bacterium]